jgi:alkylation response protein AidB-like acyl-CoA dehydrogenase
MELSFGPDETLLRDTVRRYFEREYSFDARRARMAEAEGFSRATWADMAGLGVLGAALPTSLGGFGAAGVGTLILAEACGRGLVVEPWLGTVVLGAGALELGGNAAQQALLEGVLGGETLLAFAHDEPAMRYDFDAIATRAVPDGDGFLLTGHKSVVLHGGSADWLLVSAALQVQGSAAGAALFRVPRGAEGVGLRRYVTLDGLPAADLALDGVRVLHDDSLGVPGQAWPLIERLLDRATAALCAEAVGVMDTLLARTIAYLGTRQQFGLPLARFQALQHRVADMAMQVEQARSMALVAAVHVDAADDGTRRRHVSAAKARVGQAAVFVGQAAVQLHGGIGMTDALDVSHYFKRLTLIARAFGDTDHHLARYLEATGR